VRRPFAAGSYNAATVASRAKQAADPIAGHGEARGTRARSAVSLASNLRASTPPETSCGRSFVLRRAGPRGRSQNEKSVAELETEARGCTSEVMPQGVAVRLVREVRRANDRRPVGDARPRKRVRSSPHRVEASVRQPRAATVPARGRRAVRQARLGAFFLWPGVAVGRVAVEPNHDMRCCFVSRFGQSVRQTDE
jgi:hypothetical protein